MMKIALVYGTRPEQIKLTPVAEALEDRGVDVRWFWTKQSPDLVDDRSDYVLDGIGWINPSTGVGEAIARIDAYLSHGFWPDALLVQGDTATAFAGAVAGFLAEVPVGHVEAGLRTYSDEPYPEEAFRQAVASFATWHFCPSENEVKNVLRELGYSTDMFMGVMQSEYVGIYETGNPIIDTLDSEPFRVLVTLHRRENWGERIAEARKVLHDFAENDGVRVRVITHPNWENHQESMPISSDAAYFEFEPTDHEHFMDMMQDSSVVVTDSGGLQEEAAHFGVDCIVYRTKTERTALERSGAITVVNPDEPNQLEHELNKSLEKRRAYGSGNAGERIADIIIEELSDDASN